MNYTKQERSAYFDKLHLSLSKQWHIPASMIEDLRKMYIGQGKNQIEMIQANYTRMEKTQRCHDQLALRLQVLRERVRNPSTPPARKAMYEIKIERIERDMPLLRNKIEYRQSFDLVLNKMTTDMFTALTVATPYDKLPSGDKNGKPHTTN